MGDLAIPEDNGFGVHGLLQVDQKVTGFKYLVGELFHLLVWISLFDLLFQEVLNVIEVVPHDKTEVNELCVSKGQGE